MAVSTTNAVSGPYLTNGVATTFPFTFTAPSADEVDVVLVDENNAETPLSGFTVALGQEAGGSVVFASPPSAGNSLYILLAPSFRQEIAFENGSAWRAEPVNEGYDRAAARDQALRRDVDRTLQFPIGEAGGRLPAVLDRAGKFLAFGADGSAVPASGIGSDAALRQDIAQTGAAPGAKLMGLNDGRTVQDAIATLTVDSVAALKAIPPTMRSNGMVVFLKGYYSAGDLGGGQLEFVAGSSAAPDDGSVFAPNTGSGRYHRRETDEVTTLEFGAKGDGVTDDRDAFQRWLTFLAQSGEQGWIARPPVRYRINGRLTATKTVDFDSDMKTTIDFVDPDNIGFLFALANDPFRPLNIRLPTCTTPTTQPGGNFDLNYGVSDAGPYDPATRRGTCVEIQSSSWCNIYIHRPFGFINAVVLTNAQNTGGAWQPLNNAVIEFNTVEFCDQPIHILPKGGQNIGATTVRANTVFAKRLLLLSATEGSISQVSVYGPDQLFINEPGGAVLHGIGSAINNIVARINWAACGKLPDTSSLFSALGDFSVPYLTGVGSSNGVTYDGNDPADYGQGYFQGSSCTLDLGNAIELTGIAPGGGGYPVAGDVIRIRDAGLNNYVYVRNLDQMPAFAQPLATTTAESGFLGGVGSAFFSRRVLVSAAVPMLAAGASATFYFFNQLLSTASPSKPISIVLNDVPDLTYLIKATDTSSSANRRGTVTVKNVTSGSVSGQTISFWLFM